MTADPAPALRSGQAKESSLIRYCAQQEERLGWSAARVEMIRSGRE